TKPYIWLETMDGSIQRVDVSIVTYSPIIYDEEDEFGVKLYEEPSIDDILPFINDTSE
ncbi:hypothetical protein RYX36_009697, partial [Vicia faba]